LKGVDVVVSALGVPALIGGAEKLFVDAAALAGAKRFVNSAWGIDAPATSPEFVAKEEAPKYITGRGLEFSNFTTGVWLEYTAGPFFGFDFEKFAAYVPEDGKFYFSATSLHDIAKLTTYAIQHPTSKNNTVYFSGNSLSWNEYLAVLERVSLDFTQSSSSSFLISSFLILLFCFVFRFFHATFRTHPF
jgi:hypothetical protein